MLSPYTQSSFLPSLSSKTRRIGYSFIHSTTRTKQKPNDENRLMKFQSKRVQEGVGYDGKRPKLGEVSSDVEPRKFLDLFPSFDEDYVFEELADYNCDESDHEGDDIDFGDNDDLTLIPDMVVPPSLLDFTRDMIDNSDDKTVLATYLPCEMKADSVLLEIFKSIDGVISAKLAIDPLSGLNGGFGFVTFFTKEDAQKAIEKLNGLVLDECTIKVDWVTPRKNLSPPQILSEGL